MATMCFGRQVQPPHPPKSKSLRGIAAGGGGGGELRESRGAGTPRNAGQKPWLRALPRRCVSGVFSPPVEQLDLLH